MALAVRKLRFVGREITRHGEVVYYYRRRRGERIRLPDSGPETQEFMEAYRLALSGGKPQIVHRGLFERRDRRLGAVFDRILEGACHRSQERGLKFDLTGRWAIEQVKRQNYRCALSGLAFDLTRGSEEYRRNPYAPSFDRINCRDGYTTENVRIVCLAVNIAMSDWGEAVLARVAEA